MLGKKVATLVNEKEAGKYFINFDAENLPSGIYFYILTSGNFRNKEINSAKVGFTNN